MKQRSSLLNKFKMRKRSQLCLQQKQINYDQKNSYINYINDIDRLTKQRNSWCKKYRLLQKQNEFLNLKIKQLEKLLCSKNIAFKKQNINQSIKRKSNISQKKSIASLDKRVKSVFSLQTINSKCLQRISYINNKRNVVESYQNISIKMTASKNQNKQNLLSFNQLISPCFNYNNPQKKFKQVYYNLPHIKQYSMSDKAQIKWLINFPIILMEIASGLFQTINAMVGQINDKQGNIILELLTKLLCKIDNCDRASIYMVDHIHHQLSTRIFQNKLNIQLPIGKGIAGKCAAQNQILNIPQAYKHQSFCPHFDMTNNYITKNILCVPIRNQVGLPVLIVQLINKIQPQLAFTQKDQLLIQILSSSIRTLVTNSYMKRGGGPFLSRPLDKAIIALKKIIHTEKLHQMLNIAQLELCELFGFSKIRILLFQKNYSIVVNKLRNDIEYIDSFGVSTDFPFEKGMSVKLEKIDQHPNYNSSIDLQTKIPVRLNPITNGQQLFGMFEYISYEFGVQKKTQQQEDIDNALNLFGILLLKIFKMQRQLILHNT